MDKLMHPYAFIYPYEESFKHLCSTCRVKPNGQTVWGFVPSQLLRSLRFSVQLLCLLGDL